MGLSIESTLDGSVLLPSPLRGSRRAKLALRGRGWGSTRGLPMPPPPPNPPRKGQGYRIWKIHYAPRPLPAEASGGRTTTVPISIRLCSRSDSSGIRWTGKSVRSQAAEKTPKFHMRYPCRKGEGAHLRCRGSSIQFHRALVSQLAPSPDRDAAADGAVQHLGGFLDPLGGHVQRVRHRGLRRLGTVLRRDANVAQGLQPFLQRVDSPADQMKERCGIGSVGLSNYIACANTTLSVESRNNKNANKQSLLPLKAISILARSFCAVLMEA
jgi:hypothetical protein